MSRVKPDALEDLRRRDAAAMARWLQKGHRTTSYVCPHCKARIEVRRPTRAMVSDKGCWDSLTTCTSCGRLNFVAVWPTGDTSVNRGPSCDC